MKATIEKFEIFEIIVKEEFGFIHSHSIDGFLCHFYSEKYPDLILIFDYDDCSFRLEEKYIFTEWYYINDFNDNIVKQLNKYLK